ncbi:hypothetical protein [Streptomyces sp. NPDC023838]|uniref:hypothetical protein n=1 Tax=Streptomyces sp. NPDC023838 TaxID=3154325 RepID=UPI0033F0D72F
MSQTKTVGPWHRAWALVELVPPGHPGRQRWEQAIDCAGRLLVARWPQPGEEYLSAFAMETCALVLYGGPWPLSAGTPTALSADDLTAVHKQMGHLTQHEGMDRLTQHESDMADRVRARGHDVTDTEDSLARLLAHLLKYQHPGKLYDLSLVPSLEQPYEGPKMRRAARWVRWALEAHHPVGP